VEFPWEMYTLKELLQATNNFNDSNKLGEGGFGTVYWGRTSKGVEVGDPLDLDATGRPSTGARFLSCIYRSQLNMGHGSTWFRSR
jgi:hypothetical protein